MEDEQVVNVVEEVRAAAADDLASDVIELVVEVMTVGVEEKVVLVVEVVRAAAADEDTATILTLEV